MDGEGIFYACFYHYYFQLFKSFFINQHNGVIHQNEAPLLSIRRLASPCARTTRITRNGWAPPFKLEDGAVVLMDSSAWFLRCRWAKSLQANHLRAGIQSAKARDTRGSVMAAPSA
jgi:hypothetical protein